MAKVAHVLTGIPKGSRVYVKALARFIWFDEICQTGAIGILANREAYPLLVTIRPNREFGVTRGGTRVMVDMGSEWVKEITEKGGSFDLMIKNVMEFNPGKIEVYEPYNPKVGPTLTAYQVNAKPSPETQVINRFLCEGCGFDLGHPGERWCRDCHVRMRIEAAKCEHPRLGALSPAECGNELVPGYAACEQHLEFMGIKAVRNKAISVSNGNGHKTSAPVPLLPTKRVYRHTRAYYEKRGLPVPPVVRL